MSITNTFVFIVLLGFITLGSCLNSNSECLPFRVSIDQTKISRGRWKVKIVNTCPCNILNLNFSCPNYNANKNKDRSVISKIDARNCHVNVGKRFYLGDTLTFTYVGDRVFFKPINWEEVCS
ncbi:hypothetical protein CASFOL_018883 [Castilleja foliolosa]|uniref:Uncharacterized protein n=1 Tax=Castilleja foliolosa TaxID=1961234 RepID=A0ABD3D458_9LAMI